MTLFMLKDLQDMYFRMFSACRAYAFICSRPTEHVVYAAGPTEHAFVYVVGLHNIHLFYVIGPTIHAF